jgi:hypothetical protein
MPAPPRCPARRPASSCVASPSGTATSARRTSQTRASRPSTPPWPRPLRDETLRPWRRWPPQGRRRHPPRRPTATGGGQSLRWLRWLRCHRGQAAQPLDQGWHDGVPCPRDDQASADLHVLQLRCFIQDDCSAVRCSAPGAEHGNVLHVRVNGSEIDCVQFAGSKT